MIKFPELRRLCLPEISRPQNPRFVHASALRNAGGVFCKLLKVNYTLVDFTIKNSSGNISKQDKFYVQLVYSDISCSFLIETYLLHRFIAVTFIQQQCRMFLSLS